MLILLFINYWRCFAVALVTICWLLCDSLLCYGLSNWGKSWVL